MQQQSPVDSGGKERCPRIQFDGVRAPSGQGTKKKGHRRRPRRCGGGKASREQRTGGRGTLEASTTRRSGKRSSRRSRSGERTSCRQAGLCEEKKRPRSGQIGGNPITKFKKKFRLLDD